MAHLPTHARLSLDDTQVAFESRSNAELVKMDWMFSLMNSPMLNNLATNSLLTAIKFKLPISTVVKATIFGHFCGGETLQECEKTMDALARYGIGTILDYSVEGEKSESGFDHVVAETIGTIRIAASRKDVPFAVFKTSGICDVALLEKAQAGNLAPGEETDALARGRKRFGEICAAAGQFGVRLFVDGEESWIQDTIDGWAYEEMAIYNRSKSLIFNTYQLYRADMLPNLKAAAEQAATKGYFLGAKLVRGAYMEKEAAYAARKGRPNPIQPNKQATDRDFDAGVQHCLDRLDRIHFCAGSHNEASNLRLAEAMQASGIAKNDERIWFAQLFGMSDNISYALAKQGFNVAKYVPYGPVLSVMPYLVRRAAENTSVAGQTSRELGLIRKERKRRKEAGR